MTLGVSAELRCLGVVSQEISSQTGLMTEYPLCGTEASHA